MKPKTLRIATLLFGLVGVLVLFGCAASPPVIYYTLAPMSDRKAPIDSTGSQAAMSIGVGPVSLPDVLDRPQIVTRPHPHRVDIAEFHRWGGSLKESLPRVLAENVAVCLGQEQVVVFPWRGGDRPDYRVSVDILRFDGRLGDSVELVAVWTVRPKKDDAPPVIDRAVIRMPVSGKDYEAFVDAQSRALAALAESIATAIADLKATGSAHSG